MKYNKIFIAGTGRSGTTLLNRIMGYHPDIYNIHLETKFITESDGLIDLVPALSSKYSHTHAISAYKRFDNLMRHLLTGCQHSSMRNWYLDKSLGYDNYYTHLNAFINNLSLINYQTTFPEHWRSPTSYNPSDILGEKTFLPRYFENESELFEICSTFVNEMFSSAMINNNKKIWCEKTPSNLLAIDFLYTLFPDSLIIHIKRDPRAVVLSLVNQTWAPSNIRDACYFLEGTLRKYLSNRNMYINNDNYMEIKLEDLTQNTKHILYTISNKIGINEFDDKSYKEISSNKEDYWKKSINSNDLELINTILGKSIKLLGYDI